MKNHLKIVCLGMLALSAYAHEFKTLHTQFFYNVKSTGKKLTDAQCQEYFSKSLSYHIENDQPIYLENPFFKVHQYQRLSQVKLDNHMRLYTGILKIEFKNISPAIILDEYASFVHTPQNSKIEGSFYIKDYCQGDIIGVKESKNQE